MAGTSSAGGSSFSSKSQMGMMIALFGGVAILAGGGVFLTLRIVNAFKLQESGNKATLHTPIGDVRVQKGREIGPGMPVYPHASLVLPRDNVKVDLPEATGFEVRAASYYTTDSRTLVEDWYGQHLSPEFVRHGPQDPPLPDQYKHAQVSKDGIAFVAEHGNQVRIVVLEEDNDGTAIRLVHLGKRETQ